MEAWNIKCLNDEEELGQGRRIINTSKIWYNNKIDVGRNADY